MHFALQWGGIVADRVVRGGSWGNNNENNYRCANRNNNQPENRNNNLGFRVVRSAQLSSAIETGQNRCRPFTDVRTCFEPNRFPPVARGNKILLIPSLEAMESVLKARPKAQTKRGSGNPSTVGNGLPGLYDCFSGEKEDDWKSGIMESWNIGRTILPKVLNLRMGI